MRFSSIAKASLALVSAAGCLWITATPATAAIVSAISSGGATVSSPNSTDGNYQCQFDTTSGVVQLDASGGNNSFVDTNKGSGDWILNSLGAGAWQSFGGELVQYIPGFPSGGKLRANLLFVEDAGATTGIQTVGVDILLWDRDTTTLGMRFEVFAWNEGDTAPVLSASGPNATSYNGWVQGDAVLLMDKTVGVTGNTGADIQIANNSYTTVSLGDVDTGTGYDYYAWRVGALGYDTTGGNDNFRLMNFTATASADTDGDGMDDSWEDANELNKDDPADADTDNDANGGPDGLTNLQEYLIQTNPQKADTDEDGLKDGDEVNGSLNPWTAKVKGTPPGDPTDPNRPDSDGDGVNDGDEIAAGTDPNANTGYVVPFVDTDSDSYRDEAETALGSNPNDPNDCPDFTPNPTKPNVVIIYADDLGFGDISRYGTLFGTTSASPTPNVDSLADQGVTFTQAHSANGVCSPSRYSLLTGIYNWRAFQGVSGGYGYRAGIDNIPLDEDITLAEFLKAQAYDTAAFGKWHLGGKWYVPGTNTRLTGATNTNSATVDWTRRIEGHATDIGFDLFRGLATTVNSAPYVYLHDDIVQYWVEDTDPGSNQYGDKLPFGRKGYFRPATTSDSFIAFTPTELNSTVVGSPGYPQTGLGDPSFRHVDVGPIMVADFERYIDDRVAAADSDPFFAYVALYSPHKPWAITPEFNNSTYGSYDYARWMAEVDDRIGRVLAAIDNNGMTNNTLVILTADNGPEDTAAERTIANGDDANGPLRGIKRDAWEGGTRVPFIVRWPGQAPAGMVVTDEVISQVDIFPTIAAILGSELPATTAPDGESFLNVLRGQRKPGSLRGGVALSSISGHLALKSPDGWKLIDSTGGGGNATTWDSDNNTISDAIGTKQGVPKQLFELPVDLGEDDNRIAGLTDVPSIRSELVSLTGSDLLAVLDQLRGSSAASLFPRVPDNDADGMSNEFETTHGLNRDSPKDAALDNDGDGADNLSESIAGTDPNDRTSLFRIINLVNAPATLSVTWPSVSGRLYEVFWSTDLGTWTSDSTHEGTGADIVVPLDEVAIDQADGVPGNLGRLFVRIKVARP